jgi:hypothetical protein
VLSVAFFCTVNVIMLSVVMLKVVMLIVVEPLKVLRSLIILQNFFSYS